MKCVLIAVSGGIIDEVTFFADSKEAIDRLCRYTGLAYRNQTGKCTSLGT